MTKKVTVDGKQIARGRLEIVKRAMDVIKSENPDIDWSSNDIVITIIPKREGEPEVGDDYVDAIEAIDVKWMDNSCSCHVSPPCGFCLRYGDAGLDEPEYCNICGKPSPSEGPQLCNCVA